ncbi:MAG: site-2 protease family protein [Dehalococcoidia bacterium]|mgnify:CR=1 FL=1|uniref:site-2 protease family protein n=1 Tax=Candidatus Amarobacter glycogenicus TaxID=3140699 RepID=UPI00313756DE|nr:site-2 protease family protein [Dehalococcoidia bacterium]MBK7124632.1 site-2 protease family protein [Dehalococcoidia bacterium]
MKFGNIRVGSLAGIPILVSPSWFILFGLTTWLLATQFYPDALEGAGRTTHYAMAVASVILFFASIVLHELAHSLVARAYNIPVKSITLFILGGVAQITREAAKPLHELLMAAAGPLTSFLLTGTFFAAWFALGANDTRPVDYVLVWLALMNLILGVFNLLPAFPMDGGRVFRSICWLITGDYSKATSIAAWTGRGFAAAGIACGLLAVAGRDMVIADSAASGAWIIFLGVFLENAARKSLAQNRLVNELRMYKAEDVMTPNLPVVDGGQTVGALARGVIELNPRVCYMISDEGSLAGLLSGYELRGVPEREWDNVTARQAMVPAAELRATARERLVSDVLLEMETEDLFHMPVVENGRVVGVIARDRILKLLVQAGLVPSRT